MKWAILFSFISLNSSLSWAGGAPVDCSSSYGKTTQCERIDCSEKYKTFLGKWTGDFQAYSKEHSQTKTVYRPFQNEVTYEKENCLKNISNGDTFIIGIKKDTYPAFRAYPAKEVIGKIITGQKSDGTPFLRTVDSEGINNYILAYQNTATSLSAWELTVPATDKAHEMRFAIIDGQDVMEEGRKKRNVTVTLSIGPKSNPIWESVVTKGSHTLK